MSYALDYPIVERAPASERAMFIRRTYGHLAGAILLFIGLEFVLLNIPGIGELAQSMVSSRFSWFLVLGGFMLVGTIAEKWANSSRDQATQYLGLGLYVVAEAIIFVPILWIAEQVAPSAIQSAGIATLAAFGGLTVAALITRRDFSYLGPILSVGGFLALGLIVVAMIFPQIQLGTWFSFGMVALMCGYILYYTSNIVHVYHTDQHVAASLALFACVATLFWYVLRIAMSSRD